MGNYFIFPSPKSTYSYAKGDPTLIFIPQNSQDPQRSFSQTSGALDNTRVASERIKNQIPCRFIPCQSRVSSFLIIFFHGNSEDIGSGLSQFLFLFGARFHMDVICPEYPYYGIYKKREGKLSIDEAIIEDARTVLKYCHEKMRYDYQNIILIGRSLGTTVAVKLATEFKVKGTILISPYTTIKDVAKYLIGSWLAKMAPDIFRTIDYIEDVKSPILFIHGTQDTLIPHTMSIELYDKVPGEKRIKISEDMSHNHFRLESDVFLPILEFMLQVLRIRAHFRGYDSVSNADRSNLAVEESKREDFDDLTVEKLETQYASD